VGGAHTGFLVCADFSFRISLLRLIGPHTDKTRRRRPLLRAARRRISTANPPESLALFPAFGAQSSPDFSRRRGGI